MANNNYNAKNYLSFNRRRYNNNKLDSDNALQVQKFESLFSTTPLKSAGFEKYEKKIPVSVLENNIYMHSYVSHFLIKARTYNIDNKFYTNKILDKAIKFQTARERAALKIIKENESSMKNLTYKQIIAKIADPFEQNEQELENYSWNVLGNAFIQASKQSDKITSLKELFNNIERVAQDVNNIYRNKYQNEMKEHLNNVEDGFSNDSLRRINDIKNKTLRKINHSSPEEIKALIGTQIGPLINGVVGEAMVVKTLDEIAKLTHGKITNTGGVIRKGGVMEGKQVKTDVLLEVFNGEDVLTQIGFSSKNSRGNNEISMHSAMNIDNLSEILGTYKGFEDTTKILDSNKFRYYLVNELGFKNNIASQPKKDTADLGDVQNTATNYIIQAVKNASFIWFGSVFGLKPEELEAIGTEAGKAIQNDFLVLNGKLFPFSDILKLIQKEMATQKDDASIVRFENIPGFSLNELAVKKNMMTNGEDLMSVQDNDTDYPLGVIQTGAAVGRQIIKQAKIHFKLRNAYLKAQL